MKKNVKNAACVWQSEMIFTCIKIIFHLGNLLRTYIMLYNWYFLKKNLKCCWLDFCISVWNIIGNWYSFLGFISSNKLLPFHFPNTVNSFRDIEAKFKIMAQNCQKSQKWKFYLHFTTTITTNHHHHHLLI